VIRRCVFVTLALCLGGLACGRIGYEQIGASGAAEAGAMDASADLPHRRDTGGSDASGGAFDAEGNGGDVQDAVIDVVGQSDVALTDPRDGSSDATLVMAHDPCIDVPALPVAPILDGVLEAGLATFDITPVTILGGPVPANVMSSVAVAWRSDGLYVFVRVVDPDRFLGSAAEPYCGDAVEFYVDANASYKKFPDYDDPGTRQFIIGAPPDATTIARTGTVYFMSVKRGAWTSPNFAAYPTQEGYVVEALLQAADLGLTTWSLAAGDRIGWNFGHDVSAPMIVTAGSCAQRQAEYFQHEVPAFPLDHAYKNARSFCAPMLLPPS
jgi:Carbohydrate family 9 binding domain-like